MKTEKTKPNFADILKEAVEKPGKLHAAYRAFHNYSFGNVLLIWSQCEAREIPLGPVATFKQWEKKGRRIKKGSKALAMCVPVPFEKEVENESGETETEKRMFFTFRNSWFVIDQTEPTENAETLESESTPGFDLAKCLEALKIKQVPFEYANGNAQGYATIGKREFALNPVGVHPLKTALHEIAHIELGHTDQSLHDSNEIPKNIKEVEAECVALLIIESLGLSGAEFSRGYIQAWNRGSTPIDEKTAKRIFSATDRILKAGSQ